MTLESGCYRIRFVPIGMQPPFKGGVYATATEVGEPVLAEPELPGVGHQIEVCRTQDGKYTITQPGFQSKLAGIGPVQCGWSLAHPSEVRPTRSILFKPDAIGFYLEPTGEGEHLMYSVEVPKHGEIVGVRFFVTEGGQNLVSAPFMAGVEFPPPHPHWQFIPA